MINYLPTHDISKILKNTEKYVRILDNKLKQLNSQYGAKFEIQNGTVKLVECKGIKHNELKLAESIVEENKRLFRWV